MRKQKKKLKKLINQKLLELEIRKQKKNQSFITLYR